MASQTLGCIVCICTTPQLKLIVIGRNHHHNHRLPFIRAIREPSFFACVPFPFVIGERICANRIRSNSSSSCNVQPFECLSMMVHRTTLVTGARLPSIRLDLILHSELAIVMSFSPLLLFRFASLLPLPPPQSQSSHRYRPEREKSASLCLYASLDHRCTELGSKSWRQLGRRTPDHITDLNSIYHSSSYR